MNPLNIVLLVVAGIVLSGAVAFTVGESRGRGAHNGADIGFLQDLRIHHEQAVAMSLVYIDASSAGPIMASFTLRCASVTHTT
jgi:uncharacterized protein (DUF305 family)